MITIIAGPRSITDSQVLATAIERCPWKITEVVSGAAKGVDRLGEAYARGYWKPLHRFAADWKKHGKAAGPIRNKQMADVGEALLAVWDGKSKGTKNMIDVAKNQGLLVYVHLVGIEATQ